MRRRARHAIPFATLRTALLGAGLALAGLAAPATARPLDDVRRSGTLVIAVYKDFAPWSFEVDGEPQGIDVEIGKILAAGIGVRAEFMVRMAGEDVDTDLRANVWRGDVVEKKRADVMLHVPVDHDLQLRNTEAVICCRYGEERMAVAFDPDKVPVKSFAAFRSRRIAVELDSTGDIWLSAAFGGALGANIDRGRTFAAAAETFLSGRDPALMAPRAQLEWVAAKAPHPVAIEEWPMLGIVRSSWPIGLAVRDNSRDLGHALDQVIEDATADGRLDEAHRRFGVTRIAPRD